MDRTGWKPFLERGSEEWQIANPAEAPDADPWLLLADPRTARLITPERGREILAMRRG
ncbi:hypothetical protein ACFV1N_00920 [Streptosporangium canum]|uniref:hypothetical protein n=1 Tax=Streptosporangium canum TaxID=324952 RepID=UPI0036C789D9